MAYRVMLDPGHGGLEIGDENFPKFGGCYYKENNNVIYEKDIVLQQAKLIKGWCNVYLPDIEFITTRNTDRYVSLRKRCILANKNEADLFISLHVDWWKGENAKGTTIFHHEKSKNGKDLANYISKEMDLYKEMTNRATKPSGSSRGKDGIPYIYVLDQTKMPAVLVENGFISNDSDRSVLTSRQGLFNLSECIIRGIIKFKESN